MLILCIVKYIKRINNNKESEHNILIQKYLKILDLRDFIYIQIQY
jgi:hypothetical protein